MAHTRVRCSKGKAKTEKKGKKREKKTSEGK